MKKELTQEQKQRLKIGSYIGLIGIASFIAAAICFFVRMSKAAQLDGLVKGTYEYQLNHIALESAISTCNIIAVIFLLVGVACGALGVVAMYKAGIFSKEETK